MHQVVHRARCELGCRRGALRVSASRPPFAIQALVLPDALAGRRCPRGVADGLGQDTRIRDPAGRAHRRRPRAPRSVLVLVPTRELASQIVDELQPLAAVAQPAGSRPCTGARSVTGQAKRGRSGAQVLVATPGRLQDLLERKLVSLGARAHARPRRSGSQCSTWGSARRSTASLLQMPENRQTMLFSATLEGQVADLALLLYGQRVAVHHRRSDRECARGDGRSRVRLT